MYYVRKKDFNREKREKEALERELKWLKRLLLLFKKQGKIPKKEDV